MRIVEHSDINPRGIIVIEEFSANILSRVKMNADYHQVFALHLTTNNASSIIGGEGSASLIQPPPSISAFSARLNPATFTVPIMSLIRQSSYKTSLWNLIYHSVRHSCSRLQWQSTALSCGCAESARFVTAKHLRSHLQWSPRAWQQNYNSESAPRPFSLLETKWGKKQGIEG